MEKTNLEFWINKILDANNEDIITSEEIFHHTDIRKIDDVFWELYNRKNNISKDIWCIVEGTDYSFYTFKNNTIIEKYKKALEDEGYTKEEYPKEEYASDYLNSMQLKEFVEKLIEPQIDNYKENDIDELDCYFDYDSNTEYSEFLIPKEDKSITSNVLKRIIRRNGFMILSERNEIDNDSIRMVTNMPKDLFL